MATLRNKLRRSGTTVAAVLTASMLAAHGTNAQTALSGDEQLRAEQEALFAQMLAAPDDLDLMFRHALLSITLEDYEAAISTLERMLIFNPQLSRAKVELGAAYFRLGAFENARFYFDDVLQNDNPPPEVARRVQSFLDEIGRRTRESGVNVIASFGVTYSSNANLGPSDNLVLLGGNLIPLNDEFLESDDIGFRTSLNAQHFVDLDQADGDSWITEANLFSLNYVDETRGDLDTITLRTGPRISLTPQNFGSKIRPFAYGDLVRSGNETLYISGGVGADYSNTFSDAYTMFVSAQSAWREYRERNEFDGHTHRLTAALAYTPDPQMTLTGIVYGETDRTSADFNSNIEFGGRVAGTYRYDPEFEFTDRLWSLSGFAGVAYRRFDENDPTISATTREDFDIRAGVSHVFHLTGGWFLQGDADYLYRDSNIRNFDVDNLGLTLSVGRTF